MFEHKSVYLKASRERKKNKNIVKNMKKIHKEYKKNTRKIKLQFVALFHAVYLFGRSLS